MREDQRKVPIEWLDQDQVKRLRRRVACRRSPTGSHRFHISDSKGRSDGPCAYCEVLHSRVHNRKYKNQIGGNTMATKKTATKETKVNGTSIPDGALRVADIAKKTGTEPKFVRRLLRKSFGGGGKKTYFWLPTDPKVAEIVKAVKAAKNGKGTPAPAKAEKAPAPAKAEKAPAKKATAKKAAPAPAAEKAPAVEASLVAMPPVQEKLRKAAKKAAAETKDS